MVNANNNGRIDFTVQDQGLAVEGALCALHRIKDKAGWQFARSDSQGRGSFVDLEAGDYEVLCLHQRNRHPQKLSVDGDTQALDFELDLSLSTQLQGVASQLRVGDRLTVLVDHANSDTWKLQVQPPAGALADADLRVFHVDIGAAGAHQLSYAVQVPAPPWAQKMAADAGWDSPMSLATLHPVLAFTASAPVAVPVSGNLGVSLQRSNTAETGDLAFWQAILNSTQQMSFGTYQKFMNQLFYGTRADVPAFEQARMEQKVLRANELSESSILPFTDSDAYRVIKAATEAFVMINCDVLNQERPFDEVNDARHLRGRDLPVPNDLPAMFDSYLVGKGDKTLPYLAVIRAKLPDIAMKLGDVDAHQRQYQYQWQSVLQQRLNMPCMLELIWSYWQEEGMLVQTMNAVSRRFQNIRSRDGDPLANLEIDPLRPLSSILWGYVQDEQHRLSVVRRNYEYEHHYGLRLEGRAVSQMRPADSRSRFLEAFHNLLRYCAGFYQQDDDTTVKADAFPVLNALKEVHLILSQGAHNQFGDLPSTARVEMLMQQWLLARPEFREFLPTRIMTAYPEPWMDRVDAMKKVQGWSDTSVLHFRNLAVFGEQLLLSMRWGNWSDAQDPLQAFNWARFFRPQVQGYSHAYRAVTGVDLTVSSADSRVDATLPSVLLQRRLALQQRSA